MKLIIYALFALFALFCTPENPKGILNSIKKEKAVVVFMIGNQAAIEEKQISIGTEVNENDTIVTGEKTKVDIQYEDKLFRVMPNSTFKVFQLYQPAKKFSINGKLFVKLDKLNKDETLSVTNPTMIAGVRGTTFSITNNSVSVIEGSVAITTAYGLEEIANEKDQYVLDKNKLTKKLLSVEDFREAYTMELLDVKKINDDEYLSEIEEEKLSLYQSSEDVAYEEFSKIALTEKQLEEIYGSIETVVLKNKTRYKGSILFQTSEIVLFKTKDELIKIKINDIEQVLYK